LPDYGFGRCDGHHETVDFRLRKIGARRTKTIKKAPDVPGLLVVPNKGETLERPESL
jgi:hypothetical protein